MQIGDRYGRWTIIDPNPGYRANDKILCRCDCGTERRVFRHSLTKGKSTSCGCAQRRPIAARYGRLTIIEPTAGLNQRAKVLCRCDCGTERRVRIEQLVRGETKSCGCYHAEYMRGAAFPNLAPEHASEVAPGARFGRWTALTEPYAKPGDSRRYALCRCDCGKQWEVLAWDLLKGASKSCGCLKRDANRARHQTLRRSVDGGSA